MSDKKHTTWQDRYQIGTAHNDYGEEVPVYRASDVVRANKFVEDFYNKREEVRKKENKALGVTAGGLGTFVGGAAVGAKFPKYKKVADKVSIGGAAVVVPGLVGLTMASRNYDKLDDKYVGKDLWMLGNNARLGHDGWKYVIDKKAEAHDYIIEKQASFKDKALGYGKRYIDMLNASSYKSAKNAKNLAETSLRAAKDNRNSLEILRRDLKSKMDTASIAKNDAEKALKDIKKQMRKNTVLSKKTKDAIIEQGINDKKKASDDFFSIKTRFDKVDKDKLDAIKGINIAEDNLTKKKNQAASELNKHILTATGTTGVLGVGAYQGVKGIKSNIDKRRKGDK